MYFIGSLSLGELMSLFQASQANKSTSKDKSDKQKRKSPSPAKNVGAEKGGSQAPSLPTILDTEEGSNDSR